MKPPTRNYLLVEEASALVTRLSALTPLLRSVRPLGTTGTFPESDEEDEEDDVAELDARSPEEVLKGPWWGEGLKGKGKQQSTA